MSFWSDQSSEPLRQYRWWINFGAGNALSDIRYALKKCDKPKAKIGSVQHKYLNHFYNFPGRLEWEDINITFASITNPSATKRLYDVLAKAGYGVPAGFTSPQSKSSIGKVKFNNAVGNSIELIQVNPEGNPVETWQIYKPFFTSVQFGSLDYSSEEIVEITCTLKYDYAKLSADIEAEFNTDVVNGGNPEGKT